ncbi:hypothetical protein OG883_35680 [Streptomyces sp. NBC_01142]|uniref:hypothetical protein n=1 Tax=Streptomyces sp. NBC_01142 TaxID=2975865 RepID=UPI002256F82C|nr:hypothetical protein [Streptomyces sp. NBC_01142]MCX4825112.1 hypothetical protein [Streptomyces sp. NBC_01142]
MYATITIPGVDILTLTPAQLDGIACVVCEGEDGAMVPVGTVDGCQVFAHVGCAERPTTNTGPVLIVGACQSDAERSDLYAFAFDVTDQLCRPTVVATHDHFDVRQFAAVVVYGPSLEDEQPAPMDPYAAVLEAEAHAYGVPVVAPQSVHLTAACDACAQVQTIATARNECGEVFCVDCRGESAGCAWCFEDEPTEPLAVDGGWALMCSGCAVTAHATSTSRILAAA